MEKFTCGTSKYCISSAQKGRSSKTANNEVLKICVKTWHYNFIFNYYITILQLIHYIYLTFFHAHTKNTVEKTFFNKSQSLKHKSMKLMLVYRLAPFEV